MTDSGWAMPRRKLYDVDEEDWLWLASRVDGVRARRPIEFEDWREHCDGPGLSWRIGDFVRLDRLMLSNWISGPKNPIVADNARYRLTREAWEHFSTADVKKALDEEVQMKFPDWGTW